MATFQIAGLPGDADGVDVTREAVRVLQALKTGLDGVNFAFHEYSVGAGEYLRRGIPLPADALDGCAKADAVLPGAMGLPSVRCPDGKEMTPQIDLREKFQLYCGLRPIRLYREQDTLLKPPPMVSEIDLAIVRGQFLLGVPVWRLGAEARLPGLGYFAFPGNVGGPDALAEAIRTLNVDLRRTATPHLSPH